MSDVIDIYFSQCLKNWAADKPAPKSERSRLIAQAAEAVAGQPVALTAFEGMPEHCPIRSDRDRPSEPFTQSVFCSSCIAATFRLAA